VLLSWRWSFHVLFARGDHGHFSSLCIFASLPWLCDMLEPLPTAAEAVTSGLDAWVVCRDTTCSLDMRAACDL
jgi:hypothetical protein